MAAAAAQDGKGFGGWDNGIIRVALGIYISVPFCRTKCSYCNFASDVFSRVVFERYVDRVCADIAHAPQTRRGDGRADRTRSRLHLSRRRNAHRARGRHNCSGSSTRCGHNSRCAPDAEVTVECAPGTLTPEVLESLLRCGVNRVSLGVQSFVDAEAAAVGRLHKRATVLDDIARLRAAGIANINVDLIAGLAAPDRRELAGVAGRDDRRPDAPHVSVYMLEVDEDSRLGREVIAGGTRYHAHFVPGRRSYCGFLSCGLRAAGSGGHRAIRNFQLRARRVRVAAQPEILDAAALSRLRRRRAFDAGVGSARGRGGALRRPQTSLEKYVAGSPLQKTAVIDCQRAGRKLLSRTAFESWCGPAAKLLQISASRAVDRSVNRRLRIWSAMDCLRRDGDRIRLTPRGRLLSNEVFQRFLVAPGVAVQP